MPLPEWDNDEQRTAALDRVLGDIADARRELTKAELRVLLCASHGMGGKETAALLGIAEATVKSQLSTARILLRAKTTAHACCIALRQGLLP